jgi:hypothetical protein
VTGRLVAAMLAVAIAGLFCWRAFQDLPEEAALPPKRQGPAAAGTPKPAALKPSSGATGLPAFSAWTGSLFHFPEPSPTALEEPAEAPAFLAPPIKLIGVLEVDGVRTALVAPQEGAAPVRLREGSTIGIWRVERLQRRALVLRNGMQALRFEIGRTEPAVLAAYPEDMPPAVPQIRIISPPGETAR